MGFFKQFPINTMIKLVGSKKDNSNIYDDKNDENLNIKKVSYHDFMLITYITNSYDTNAIALIGNNLQILGYIPASISKYLSPLWLSNLIDISITNLSNRSIYITISLLNNINKLSTNARQLIYSLKQNLNFLHDKYNQIKQYSISNSYHVIKFLNIIDHVLKRNEITQNNQTYSIFKVNILANLWYFKSKYILKDTRTLYYKLLTRKHSYRWYSIHKEKIDDQIITNLLQTIYVKPSSNSIYDFEVVSTTVEEKEKEKEKDFFQKEKNPQHFQDSHDSQDKSNDANKTSIQVGPFIIHSKSLTPTAQLYYNLFSYVNLNQLYKFAIEIGFKLTSNIKKLKKNNFNINYIII